MRNNPLAPRGIWGKEQKREIKRTIEINEKISAIIEVSAAIKVEKYNVDGVIAEGEKRLFESQEVTLISGGKIIDRGRLSVLDPENKFDAQHIENGAYARLDKVKFSKETFEKINAVLQQAILEVTTPEIAAHKAAIKEAIQIDADSFEESEAHRAYIYKKMNP
ncbi:hypothetical protein [Carnimonas bestiolae]|uniref:hypothetical protein n=1 Tax=Carnimonas bestiolae TaxID=3402172 RepID=UPI003EDBE684